MTKAFKNSNLWISIIFLLLYFSVSSVLDFSWSKKYFANNIQNEINELSRNMENVLHSSLVTNPNISILTYEEDSLIFWTTHKFPEFNFNELHNNETTIVFREPGIYLVHVIINQKKKNLIFYKLQNNFAFENEYLINSISDDFGLPDGVQLTKKATDYPIKNNKGEDLAYVSFKTVPPSNSNAIILISFLILSFIFFISFLFKYLDNKVLSLSIKRIISYSTLIIIFIIISYSGVFAYVRRSLVFQPESFAFSGFFPSMMVFFFASLTLFFALLLETKWALQTKTMKPHKVFALLMIIIQGLAFALFIKTIQILADNTSVDIDLSSIASFNMVGIFGVAVLISMAINFLMMSNLILISLKKLDYKFNIIIVIFMVVMGVVIFFILGTNIQACFNAITLILLYGIISFKLHKRTFSQSGYYIALAVLISYIINFNLVEVNIIKEQNKRQILIQSLALNQDPEAEYLFGKIESKIYKDSVLRNIIKRNWLDDDKISKYILDKYFKKNKHWRKYDFQFTLCDQQTNLLVKPSNMEVSCDEFFYKNLIYSGHMTINKNLYRLEYGSGQINYLGLFRFHFEDNFVFTIYLEINSKIKRKGFTKLLSPSGFDPFEKIRKYSLAKYDNHIIVESYGDFTYPYEITDSLETGVMIFRDAGMYNHLYYKLNDKEIFVLSKPKIGLLSQIAPFAYLFILVILITLIFLPYLNRIYGLWLPPQSFSFRLQMSFISLLAVSLVIIALISTYYIKELNHEKDAKILKKTAFSLQTEFEHKLANTLTEGEEMSNYLNDLSLKFSKVFNADINLYSLEGDLISTTKPELYKYHFISHKINPRVLSRLRKEKNTYLTYKERIGKLEYHSAYMPFHDANNKIVAYLNLPYFAQQDQLKKDVSSFVMTLMNVYTFMIVISILLILLLSNYIIRPLRMIKEMMQKIRIGKKNEYIVWNRKDEIGELVSQYNLMVDELAKSAEILAKSERESAWRQMARQVAHEIKNPLTPMKLSLQYLLKALDDGQPDWEDRLRKLSATLIEQIDALAAIATAFSDFAKMPVGEKEHFDLKNAIDASIKIFQDYENITITFNHTSQDNYVFADKKNLIRVFNNLIKNAIQSIPFNKDGFIDIDIQEEESDWKISIKDNGSGIPKEEIDKIFIPNFTTKSGGMGLGLAMVRNIILSQGGNIDFETQEDKGTTFYIYIKKSEYEQGS